MSPELCVQEQLFPVCLVYSQTHPFLQGVWSRTVWCNMLHSLPLQLLPRGDDKQDGRLGDWTYFCLHGHFNFIFPNPLFISTKNQMQFLPQLVNAESIDPTHRQYCVKSHHSHKTWRYHFDMWTWIWIHSADVVWREWGGRQEERRGRRCCWPQWGAWGSVWQRGRNARDTLSNINYHHGEAEKFGRKKYVTEIWRVRLVSAVFFVNPSAEIIQYRETGEWGQPGSGWGLCFWLGNLRVNTMTGYVLVLGN